MAVAISAPGVRTSAESPRTGPIEVVAVTLGVLVLVTILRAWLPTLVITHGQSAGPGGTIVVAGAAAGVVGLAVLAARIVGADRLAVAGALVAALALIAAGAPGKGGIGLLSIALGGAFVWLGCAAMTVRSGRWAAIGLTAGLGAAVALHAVLDTVDLVWRSGPLPAIGLAVLSCAFVGSVAGAMNWHPDAPSRRAGVRGTVWLLAGPALALTGMVTGATARADAAAEAMNSLPSGWGSAAVSAAALLAVGLAARPRLTRHPAVPAVVLVLAVAAAIVPRFRIDGIAGTPPSWTVACQVAGALALGAALGWVGIGVDTRAAFSAPANHAVRRGVAAALGVLALAILTGGYLSVRPDIVVPTATAVGIAAATLTAGRRALRWGAPAGRPAIDTAVAVAAVLAAVVIAAVQLLPAPASVRMRALRDFPVRLVAYDINLAFGADGRFQPESLAATIRAQNPDVVLLSEVDRGWFLSGGHDSLRLIADRLGMRAIFAPSADPVRGDALLTRLPVVAVRGVVLPSGAQLLSAVLSVGEHELGVLGSRLGADRTLSAERALADARAAAGAAADLAADERPVVLAGNLGATPGNPVLAALLDGVLGDGLAKARPLRTYPAAAPALELDGVLVTSDLDVTDVHAPASSASDHLPVTVSLTLTDPEALRPTAAQN